MENLETVLERCNKQLEEINNMVEDIKNYVQKTLKDLEVPTRLLCTKCGEPTLDMGQGESLCGPCSI